MSEPDRTVAVCRWCDTLLVHDDEGRWIHIGLSYYCRDRWGVLMSTTAEPLLARWTAVYRAERRSRGC